MLFRSNKTMKRRGKSVQREISILERLQNIRAMLIEVRESLGDDGQVEYEAPIDAVNELISDVEQEAKVQVVEAVTNHDDVAEDVAVEVAEDAEEPAPEPQPKRRGRPRKNPEAETEPAPEGAQPAVRRRSRAKKEESKELFPFYEQSLF